MSWATFRNFFKPPFRTEKRFLLMASVAMWASEDFRILICSYLQRTFMGVSDWDAIGYILGTFVFFILYWRFKTRKTPRARAIQRAYIWSLNVSQILQSKATWYKVRLLFYLLIKKVRSWGRYLPKFAPKPTLSDETLEKKLLMRHYKNILNRHR